MNRTTLRAWFFLFRPWSYTATLIPFLVAAGIGICGGADRWGHWFGGLVAGFFFQATVNLLNTWGDERSGVDDAPGAIRTTPQVHEGLVSMRALLTAALLCAFIASALGLGLCFYREKGVWQFNWVLLAAGFVGFLGSVNYSTGVKFKYRGLGVPFVSFLMGPLEIFVALLLLEPTWFGSLRSLPFALFFLVFTLPIAALVGVIMHGNDMRDIPSDRAAGIVTLASWLGPRGALVYYWVCHLLPYVVCGALAIACMDWLAFFTRFQIRHLGFFLSLMLPYLCLPLTVKTLRTATAVYRSCPQNPPWRGLERGSGKILFVFGVLYALSFLARVATMTCR